MFARIRRLADEQDRAILLGQRPLYEPPRPSSYASKKGAVSDADDLLGTPITAAGTPRAVQRAYPEGEVVVLSQRHAERMQKELEAGLQDQQQSQEEEIMNQQWRFNGIQPWQFQARDSLGVGESPRSDGKTPRSHISSTLGVVREEDTQQRSDGNLDMQAHRAGSSAGQSSRSNASLASNTRVHRNDKLASFEYDHQIVDPASLASIPLARSDGLASMGIGGSLASIPHDQNANELASRAGPLRLSSAYESVRLVCVCVCVCMYACIARSWYPIRS
jgi:hypothetical protein